MLARVDCPVIRQHIVASLYIPGRHLNLDVAVTGSR